MTMLLRPGPLGLLLFLVFAPVCRGQAEAEQESEPRRALVVGISDYPTDGGWFAIPGAVRDARAIETVLRERFGFDENDIVTLLDEEATHDNIVHAFEEHLIDGSGPETTALFYYAGHGSQVTDLSGDERDGLDETLVPFDSRGVDDSRNDLLDDDIGWLCKSLAAKTPHAVVIFDACHSGSAMRGTPSDRLLVRMSPRGILGKRNSRAPALDKDEPDRTGPALPESAASPVAATLVESGEAEFLFLSACLDHQFALEDRDDARGLFTSSLERRLRSAEPEATWKDLYDRVHGDLWRLRVDQEPLIHGRADQRVFGGAVDLGPARFTLEWGAADSELQVCAGPVHGVAPGCRLLIQKVAGAAPVGIAEFTAEVDVVLGPSLCRLRRPEAGWPEGLIGRPSDFTALLVEGAAPEWRVRLHVPADESTQEALRPLIELGAQCPLFETTTDPDAADLLATVHGGRLSVSNLGGAQVLPHPVRPVVTDPEVLVQDLEAYCLWYSTRAIENPSSPLHERVLIEVQTGWFSDRSDEMTFQDREGLWDVGTRGQPVLRLDRVAVDPDGPGVPVMMVKLANRNPRRLYLTLLDIRPDWSIDAICPHPNYLHEHLATGIPLEPGESISLPIGVNDEGWNVPGIEDEVEVFKFFLSEEPQSFVHLRSRGIQPIEQAPFSEDRGAEESTSRLGELLWAARRGGATRGIAGKRSRGDLWMSVEVPLTVVPAAAEEPGDD